MQTLNPSLTLKKIKIAKQNLSYLLMIYEHQKKEILSHILISKNEELIIRAKSAISKNDEVFKKLDSAANKVVNTEKQLDDFLTILEKYNNSGYVDELNFILKRQKIETNTIINFDKDFIKVERNSESQANMVDEHYFNEYLNNSKKALIVYRGDSRGVNLNSLDNNFQFSDIEAGGTTDISFFGMVQHIYSNTNKNGMVSTTSDKSVAHHFATSQKGIGLIYSIEVKQYLDVNFLLKKRNFKSRFEDQKEILIPGSIEASQIKSVTLYQGKNVIKTIYNK